MDPFTKVFKEKNMNSNEDRFTRMDCQFCLSVYLKDEYMYKSNASNLYSDWGGVEFDNSWKGGIKHAQNIVAKHPNYLCVLIDMMNRKKPLEIFES